MQQAPPLLRRRISFMEGDDYLNIDFQSICYLVPNRVTVFP